MRAPCDPEMLCNSPKDLNSGLWGLRGFPYMIPLLRYPKPNTVLKTNYISQEAMAVALSKTCVGTKQTGRKTKPEPSGALEDTKNCPWWAPTPDIKHTQLKDALVHLCLSDPMLAWWVHAETLVQLWICSDTHFSQLQPPEFTALNHQIPRGNF